MFRLAHISDVHLGPLPPVSAAQLFSKRITGYLNWKLNRERVIGPDYLNLLIEHLQAEKPDHIAVTGDLVNLSLPLEFLSARDFLENLGSEQKLSVICGNHDAYVPGAIRRAIKAWQPFLSGDDRIVEKKKDFPYLRTRGDIALIGCNSAGATGPFMATGYFRRRQAKALGKILQETQDKCRIVMIHHPPVHDACAYHKRLVGIDRFQKVIREFGAELILHGHTHQATRNEINGPNGPVPVMCVPAAGNSTGNLRPPGRFNLFEIEKDGNNWNIRWTAHGQSAAGSEFRQLVDETL